MGKTYLVFFSIEFYVPLPIIIACLPGNSILKHTEVNRCLEILYFFSFFTSYFPSSESLVYSLIYGTENLVHSGLENVDHIPLNNALVTN